MALKPPSPDSAREAGREHLHLSDSQGGFCFSYKIRAGESIPPGAVYVTTCLLHIYYVLGTILGTGDAAVSTADITRAVQGLTSCGEMGND